MTTTATTNSIETVTTTLSLDLNKELTQPEMEAFFAGTKEYTVEKARGEFEYELHKEGQFVTMYKPTMKTLIRSIAQLEM